MWIVLMRQLAIQQDMRREQKSPSYTTDMNELMEAW
jgi:hypothetical protein